jgi:anti-anti-sigma factor
MATRELTLRLHSGIPVVEIDGEWSAALAEAVMSMLTSLQHAGHFEIVLNIQRTALGSLSGLRSLAGEVSAFRSHHGHLDVVGTVEQLDELVRSGLASLFRLAHSEEIALSRIKRTPVFASGPRLMARPLD